MPTPDGREWYSSGIIADRLMDRIKDDVPRARRAALRELLKEGFAGLYGIEFKILRLTEKLKDAIESGQFNTVEEIRVAFKEIYTMDVLNAVDEDGELL